MPNELQKFINTFNNDKFEYNDINFHTLISQNT